MAASAPVSSPVVSAVSPSAAPNESGAPSPEVASAAYARVRPFLQKIRPDEYLAITVEVPHAAAIALGAWPKIAAYRERIAGELPQFAIDELDRLEDYALAAWYTAVRSPGRGSESPATTIAAEAAPLRERLLVAAEALVLYGHFDAAEVANVKSGTGHMDVANDLAALGALYREKWSAVGGKTPVTRQEVDQAERLGTQLVKALGARAQPGGEKIGGPELVEERVRAFTALARSYEACRRAIGYLRWAEDDVDSIAPSLYTRRRRSASSPAVTPPEPPPAPPVAPLSPFEPTGGIDG